MAKINKSRNGKYKIITNKEKYISATEKMIGVYKLGGHSFLDCHICEVGSCKSCPLYVNDNTDCNDLPYYQPNNDDYQKGLKRAKLHEYALKLYKDMPNIFFTKNKTKKMAKEFYDILKNS